MHDTLAQQAIKYALAGNWQKAIETNKQILQQDAENIEALNRLAKACSKVGQFKMAKKYAKKVLSIDQYNTIATKSLEKWKDIEEDGQVDVHSGKINTFLEEPGKTAIIKLLNLGASKLTKMLDAGDEIDIACGNHRVVANTKSGKYIGRLPDDVAARIRELMKLGNEYEAYVKSADRSEVTIFVKETKRSPNLANVPSFSTERVDYISFTPPELVRKKEPIVTMDNDKEE